MLHSADEIVVQCKVTPENGISKADARRVFSVPAGRRVDDAHNGGLGLGWRSPEPY